MASHLDGVKNVERLLPSGDVLFTDTRKTWNVCREIFHPTHMASVFFRTVAAAAAASARGPQRTTTVDGKQITTIRRQWDQKERGHRRRRVHNIITIITIIVIVITTIMTCVCTLLLLLLFGCIMNENKSVFWLFRLLFAEPTPRSRVTFRIVHDVIRVSRYACVCRRVPLGSCFGRWKIIR